MEKLHKVLMLVENRPAPADKRLWDEAIALRDAGFLVSVISPKDTEDNRESYICLDGIHVYRYGLPATSDKWTSYIVEYVVAMVMTFLLCFVVLFRQGFDVIHAANPPDTFFVLGLVFRLFGKKFVYDQHDLSPEMFQIKFSGRMKFVHSLHLFLERCSYQTADIVIASNEAFKHLAMQRGHCPADKIFVVHNTPNLLKRFKQVPFEPALKGSRPYMLAFVGVMEAQDGVEYALYAIHELVHKRGRRDVSAVFMGHGDHAPVLHALSHELQLDEYVTFTGWTKIEDVSRYLTAMDIGLSPDPVNGLSEYCTMIKVLEYMAVGKPFVSFDLTATRLLAQDSGLYATPNRVEDFADKLEILLDDEELRLKLGTLGRKYIEETLNWDHEQKNILLAYEYLYNCNINKPDNQINIITLLQNKTKNMRIKYRLIKEKILGIDIFQEESAEGLNLDPTRSEYYSTSGNRFLKRVLNCLDIQPTDSIIDFGCGKGGALVTMSRYPFQELGGVELSPKLCQIAKRNIKKLHIKKIELYCCDAVEFKSLDDYNYIYFYNPFKENIMKTVIENIVNNLEYKPRKLTIIYNNPVCHEIIVNSSVFSKKAEFPSAGGLKFNIYTN